MHWTRQERIPHRWRISWFECLLLQLLCAKKNHFVQSSNFIPFQALPGEIKCGKKLKWPPPTIFQKNEILPLDTSYLAFSWKKRDGMWCALLLCHMHTSVTFMSVCHNTGTVRQQASVSATWIITCCFLNCFYF